MKRVLEFIIIVLLIFSIIEFFTAVGGIILYEYFNYVNNEALNTARIYSIQFGFCVLFALVVTKLLSFKREEIKVIRPKVNSVKNKVMDSVMSEIDKSKQEILEELKDSKKDLLKRVMKKLNKALKTNVKTVKPEVKKIVLEDIKEDKKEKKDKEKKPNNKTKKGKSFPWMIILTWMSIFTIIGPLIIMLVSKKKQG
jgi:hypothetical protein